MNVKIADDSTLIDRLSPGVQLGRTERDEMMEELARRARDVEATNRLRAAYTFVLLERLLHSIETLAERRMPTASDIAHAIHHPD
jgi:hypothetical protein